jgi:TPR repeat protein
VYWYQKAADQGYAEAQSNLGIAYAFGKGVLKDDKQAVYWYQKAADQGCFLIPIHGLLFIF